MGASKGNPGMSGSGGVIRGNIGNFVAGFASYIGAQTSVYAEASAVLERQKLVSSLSFTKVWIELDSKYLS